MHRFGSLTAAQRAMHIVLIDFTVNDRRATHALVPGHSHDRLAHQAGHELLIRKMLSLPQKPAVLHVDTWPYWPPRCAIETSENVSSDAELVRRTWHMQIARHYRLPAVSLAAAICFGAKSAAEATTAAVEPLAAAMEAVAVE